MEIPDLPRCSKIRVRSGSNGVKLSWMRPSDGLLGWLFAASMLFALGMGGSMIVTCVEDLFSRMSFSPSFAFWLGGSILAVLFNIGIIFLMLRPQKPESVTLVSGRFTYDTGLPPLNITELCFTSWFDSLTKRRSLLRLSRYFRSKTHEFSRSDCPEFVLERVDKDQRLRFDDGADRVIIGETLREPEREWLARVLDAWRTG